MRKIFLSFFLLLSACDDRFDVLDPSPKKDSEQDGNRQSHNIPNINLVQTKFLFSLISSIELGNGSGKVELLNNGILMHPGDSKPTIVNFNLSKKYKVISIRPYISKLPDDAVKLKQAGTVNLKILADNHLLYNAVVNRETNIVKELNILNQDKLTLIVDNFDEKPWFDWLIIGVTDFK